MLIYMYILSCPAQRSWRSSVLAGTFSKSNGPVPLGRCKATISRHLMTSPATTGAKVGLISFCWCGSIDLVQKNSWAVWPSTIYKRC